MIASMVRKISGFSRTHVACRTLCVMEFFVLLCLVDHFKIYKTKSALNYINLSSKVCLTIIELEREKGVLWFGIDSTMVGENFEFYISLAPRNAHSTNIFTLHFGHEKYTLS